MAKKQSASSQPEKLVRKTSEDIKNRRWTKAEMESMRRIAESQARGDDSDIDYSDIPELTDEQLARVVRFRDVRPKVAVSVRLEPRVLAWLKEKGAGHLTRINTLLVYLMESEQQRAAGLKR